jgi:hypothetical protein
MVTTTPVTIEQAAAILGVSASTIRRRIRAGALQVTETHRPQGTVWLVHLPPGVTPAAEAATVDTAPVDTAPTAQPTPALAQADALASLIQATLTPIIAPLVGELAASRQALERQAGEVRELEREVGRVSALLDSARAQIRTLTAPTASQSVEPATEPSVLFLRRRWLWVAVLIAFVVLTAWLLAWPR